jgi:DNA-directed RNA polymerase subunit RPC12/RpoP
VAQEIKCSHCGAPVEFKPGEIIATCRYCGFTTVIETVIKYEYKGKVYQLILEGTVGIALQGDIPPIRF